jgi:hypothetical protein
MSLSETPRCFAREAAIWPKITRDFRPSVENDGTIWVWLLISTGSRQRVRRAITHA